MKYIVTGVDGQLGRRVAKNMLDHVDGNALIFTAPNLNRIPREVLIKWKSEKVEIRNTLLQLINMVLFQRLRKRYTSHSLQSVVP